MTSHDPQLTYRDAGVDIDAGAALVERIKPLAAATARPGVVSAIGGFGALFELPLARYENPLVVATTDGVGTKLRVALDAGRHHTVGIDLVAMCANDILAQGAEPLFFLDYFATGRLDVDVAEAVVRGIAEGCRLAGVALIGGETAEMPGMYRSGDYDLAGFCVGIVERDRVVDGRHVVPGDRLIGLASSGPHSNGYSLIRRILEVAGADLDAEVDGRPLRDALLEPTRIYVRDLEPLLAAGRAKGIAHITGGGLSENVARILPPGVGAVIERERWALPPVFRWLQAHGRVADAEMHRTFNCGLGLVVAVDAQHAAQCLGLLAGRGVDAFEIGGTIALSDGAEPVTIR